MKEASKVIEILGQIAKIKDQLDTVKPLYQELDDLVIELTELVDVGETLILEDRRFATIVDNFSEKNTVFKVAGVKRFDIEILTKDEMDKKITKAAKKSK